MPPLISLRPFSHTLEAPATPQFAAMVAQALFSLVKPLFQQELQAMSDTLTEAVSSLTAAAQRVEAQLQAEQAASASKDQTIASLQSQLTAAQGGDPTVISAIDAVTSGLNAAAPAPAESTTEAAANTDTLDGGAGADSLNAGAATEQVQPQG